MQSDLERNFFHQEARVARWGTVLIFAVGIAVFLGLFVAMVALSVVVGNVVSLIKQLIGFTH